jgi:hypothetical protein
MKHRVQRRSSTQGPVARTAHQPAGPSRQRQPPEVSSRPHGGAHTFADVPVQAAGESPVHVTPSKNSNLPDGLKAGIESLSGVALDSVNVHLNSPRPARLGAHAYAEGKDIHVSPGQQHHLPQEAWHVAQQLSGRVKPTARLNNGVPLNDDPALEREAVALGRRALTRPTQRSAAEQPHASTATPPRQQVVQRERTKRSTDGEFKKLKLKAPAPAPATSTAPAPARSQEEIKTHPDAEAVRDFLTTLDDHLTAHAQASKHDASGALDKVAKADVKIPDSCQPATQKALRELLDSLPPTVQRIRAQHQKIALVKSPKETQAEQAYEDLKATHKRHTEKLETHSAEAKQAREEFGELIATEMGQQPDRAHKGKKQKKHEPSAKAEQTERARLAAEQAERAHVAGAKFEKWKKKKSALVPLDDAAIQAAERPGRERKKKIADATDEMLGEMKKKSDAVFVLLGNGDKALGKKMLTEHLAVPLEERVNPHESMTMIVQRFSEKLIADASASASSAAPSRAADSSSSSPVGPSVGGGADVGSSVKAKTTPHLTRTPEWRTPVAKANADRPRTTPKLIDQLRKNRNPTTSGDDVPLELEAEYVEPVRVQAKNVQAKDKRTGPRRTRKKPEH